MRGIDCWQTSELICCYCGHKYRDGWELPESGTAYCGGCDKEFGYEKEYSVTYSTYKMRQKDSTLTKEEYKFLENIEAKKPSPWDDMACNAIIFEDRETLKKLQEEFKDV